MNIRPRSRHQAKKTDPVPHVTVPVVLPHVVFTVAADGTMTVTIDGAPHDPARFAPPWRRADFARILDEITARRHAPVRVEVREADGTVFTDIITPPRHHHTSTDNETDTPAEPAADEGVLTLAGDRFAPGEEVAVAVITAATHANPDGTAAARVTDAQLIAALSGEAVLVGRVSGTIVVGRRP